MIRYIILAVFLTTIPFVASLGADVEFSSGVTISPSDNEKKFRKNFWNHISSMEFDEAVKFEKEKNVEKNRYLYGHIYSDVVRVINKTDSTQKVALRDFFALEQKRLEWEYFLFDDSVSELEIIAQIDSVIVGFERFYKSKKSTNLRDEVMYRLALSYQSYGSFGVNRFNEAVRLFYGIIKDYPDSDLVDDAEFGIIMTQVNREYALGRVTASIEDRVKILKEFIKVSSGSNKLIEARHKLATEYYFQHDHSRAIKEYKKILVSNTKNNLLVLEVLKDLIDWCKGEQSNNCDHKKYVKIMQDRFPDTEYSKWATGRLEE